MALLWAKNRPDDADDEDDKDEDDKDENEDKYSLAAEFV